MIEQIFGSTTRVQLITLFIRNPEKGFYVREIGRITGQYINSIRRELANLEQFGLIKPKEQDRRKYYSLDKDFFLVEEIRELFLKAQVFLETNLTNSLKQLGEINVLIFTGVFTAAPTQTDLLIVGDNIESAELNAILERFSLTLGSEVRYTVFTTAEYQYRKDITDHFLYDILNNKNIVIVNKLE